MNRGVSSGNRGMAAERGDLEVEDEEQQTVGKPQATEEDEVHECC